MKSQIIGKEARKQARFENDQIWPRVLDWAARAGHISRAATRACIEYNPETAPVILKKGQAAEALIKVGYTPDEAQRRVGLERQAVAKAPDLAAARAEDEERPEPGYAEKMAARLTERGDLTCPHGRDRYCRSCGVRRRHEERDGVWVEVWHPIGGVA